MAWRPESLAVYLRIFFVRPKGALNAELTKAVDTTFMLCQFLFAVIPEFNQSGLLPEGIHWADMNEIERRYAKNEQRKRLLSGFKRAVDALRTAGCSLVYLDGSFVTEKELPDDYDACWETQGVTLKALDPVLLDFSNRRAAQKTKYFGELFPAHLRAENCSPFKIFFQFFQVDKVTGEKKGIIGIKLPMIL
jgi:hypothetical protein